MNPYPTLPGYPARVAFAIAVLKAKAEGREGRFCKLTNDWANAGRAGCFDGPDADAVVWEVMRRGHADFTLWRGIQIAAGDDLARWKVVAAYRGPQLALAL